LDHARLKEYLDHARLKEYLEEDHAGRVYKEESRQGRRGV